jgi:hypothetical protein
MGRNGFKMTLKLIEFIKEHPTDWREILLNPPYSIDIKESDNLLLFKYNQIESEDNDITRECRGVILNKNDYKIVCFPFIRFFNYGDPKADKIDFSNARILEKVDGSLIKIFNFDGKFRISTSGTIDAFKCKCGMTEQSFGDIFLEAWNNTMKCDFYEFAEKNFNKTHTVMLELVHPLNRVVVAYPEPKVYHTGTRDNTSYNELEIDYGLPKPKSYKFNTLDEVINTLSILTPNEEGYVIVENDTYKRLKCKGIQYLNLHILKSNGVFTYRRILSLIWDKKDDDILAIFPEYTKYFNFVREKYIEYINKIKENINIIKNKTYSSKKDYAMEVKELPCADYFFKVWDKKCEWDGLEEYLYSLGSEKVIKYMNIKELKVEE